MRLPEVVRFRPYMVQENEHIAAIKQRLDEYRIDDREIENQLERLERLEAKMKDVGAQVITDMPRSPSPAHDRMADYVSQKDSLTETLRRMIRKHSEDREVIERVVAKGLKKPDERAVIRYRYVDMYEWPDVIDCLFGGKEDYIDKEDTYKRKTYALHSDAIYKMTEYVEMTNDPFWFSS